MTFTEQLSRLRGNPKEDPLTDSSLEGKMLRQLNPVIGEPSTHFTWFSKAELTAWGKDLGDSTLSSIWIHPPREKQKPEDG